VNIGSFTKNAENTKNVKIFQVQGSKSLKGITRIVEETNILDINISFILHTITRSKGKDAATV